MTRVTRRSGTEFRSTKKSRSARSLGMECLDDRRMLATFTVMTSDDAGAGSLRQSILDANASAGNDTIQFDSALFSSPQTIHLNSQLPQITEGVDLVGPGAANATIDGGDAHRIFYVFDPSSAIEVSMGGLTLANGRADDGGDIGNFGGGIYSAEAMTLTDMVFMDNVALDGGGGFYGGGALTRFENVHFEGNMAINLNGGGFWDGNFELINSTVKNNSAVEGGGIFGAGLIQSSTIEGNSAEEGGGLFLNAGTATIAESTVTGNTANISGGGIRSLGGSTLNVTGSLLSGNSSHEGGAIYNQGTANVADSSIRDNSADDGGGIFNHGAGQLTLTSSTLSINDGLYSGGAIFNAGTATATGGFLYGNSGDFGGAIYNTGEATFTGSTITGNSAYAGGAIHNSGTATITGGTFAGNLAEYGGAINNLSLAHISGATLTENVAVIDGGGIRNSSILHLTDSTVSVNSAIDGGGIFNSGTAYITNTILAENMATRYGGAISSEGTVHVTDSTISGNTANYGGGVDFSNYIRIAGTTLANNVATENGGGIRASGTLTVTGSMLSGNSATNGGGIHGVVQLNVADSTLVDNVASETGGGIFNDGGLDVVDSLLSGNSAGVDGGGVFSANRSTFVRSTLRNNSAGHFGGGIRSNGDLSVTDSTLSGNVANSGGGVSNSDFAIVIGSTISGNSAEAGGGFHNMSTGVLTSSTLTNNSADYGGGLFAQYGAFENVQGTIVAGNSATIAGGNVFTGPQGSLDVNVFNLIDVDPMLGSLADNGGPTQTHALLPGSPAINAGATFVAGGTDQRGEVRVVGGVVDIGSVEADPPVVRTLGSVPDGMSTQSAYNLRAGENVFYRFDLDADVTAADGSSLVIDTLGSTLTQSNDTEIGLYDASGNLIAENDDLDGSTVESRLLFGDGGSIDLPTGEYYLALGANDTTFNATDFDVSSSSSATGDVVVNFNLQQATTVPCDFDGDGVCSGSDIDLLQENLVDGPLDPATYDLTGDGQVTIADRDEWLVQAGAANLPSGGAYLLGDANLDGTVDGSDFLVWSDNKFQFSSAWTNGDFNSDGAVDGIDFLIWNANKFQGADSGNVAAPWRETASLLEGVDDTEESRRYVRDIDDLFATLA